MLNASLKLVPLALLITSLAACGAGSGVNNGDDNVINDGGNPTDPIDPTDPTDPTDPIDPIDPTENIAPTFTSAISASVDENINGAVYTTTAIDANNDALTFAISGGADQAAFSIDAASGELSLNNPADFEAPIDTNADNVYEVTLSVDDGNGASDQLALSITVDDVTQLALHVSYPTPNANLGGDVEFTSVTGFLEDLEDGEVLESDVDFVSVNFQGADIELPTDQNLAQEGTVRWRTQLPIANIAQKSTLNIELADNSGNTEQANQILLNRFLLEDLQGVELDSDNNRALVLDLTLDALVAIDLENGDRTILSDASIGNGTNLDLPRQIMLDSANNRALVVDSALNALIAIDLTNGDRSIISDANTGTGTKFKSLARATLDSVNNRALVIDTVLDALFAIDLESGDRTTLSDKNTGTGPNLRFPFGVALDGINNRALVIDRSLGALFAIDLENGNRTILSDADTGSGAGLVEPVDISLDSANDRVIVVSSQFNSQSSRFLGELTAIDLNNGDRTILSDPTTGAGVTLEIPFGVALDSANNRALVIDVNLDTLIFVDLASGDRTTPNDSNTGLGDKLDFPLDTTQIDHANNRVIVLNTVLGESGGNLVAIDLGSGNRTILRDINTGAPKSITLDSANNRVLVSDNSGGKLISFDLESGQRTILSDDNIGDGIKLESPDSMTLDSDNNRALVVDSRLEALLAVDLTNGARTIISDAVVGTGVNFEFPAAVALDSVNNLALVLDRGLQAVVAIDLTNGDRSIISGDTTGTGINLSSPTARMALDTVNNRVLIANPSFGGVIAAFDLESGIPTVLSDSNTGTGVSFGIPRSISLDSANNRAFVVDGGLSALVVVDLETGERAIASKADDE